MDIVFWDFLLCYQIFFSPQVKRSAIMYELGSYKIRTDLEILKTW